MGKKHGKVFNVQDLEGKYPAEILNSTAVVPDPAHSWPGAPPEFGVIRPTHIDTVSGWIGSQARTYPNEDEAVRHSRVNSELMRHDTLIMECLKARQRAVALLPWHLQPEDETDPRQKQLVADLTSIMERTYRFTELRRWLMEAIWFGKSFAQLRYWPAPVKGMWRKIVKYWEPRHPDKIVFRYSDGSKQYAAGQPGILVNAHAVDIDRNQVEATQYGLAYFLKDHERRVCLIHKHEVEDGPFADPYQSGRIHGVGVRDTVYWTWFASKEVEQKLLEYLDRTALGIEIWRYPSGNKEAENAARKAATERIGGGRSIVLVPVIPGEQAELFGVQHIEPGPQGAELLKTICQEFYGHRIKRLIMGQVLTSEAEATGMGSGVADAHLATFSDIVRYDAINLQETLTEDFVNVIKEENFPWARSVYIRLIINTERPEVENKLAAYQAAWNMGLKVRAEDIYALIGARRPDEEDDVLQNPNIMMAEQQQAMMMAQAGMPPPGQDPNAPDQGGSGTTVFPPMGQAGAALDQMGGDPNAPPQMEVAKTAAAEPGAQPVNPWAGFWDSLFAAARGQGISPPVGEGAVEAAQPVYKEPPQPAAPQVDRGELARRFHSAFETAIARGQTAEQFRDSLEQALGQQPDADQLRTTMQFLFAWKTAEPVGKLKAALGKAVHQNGGVHSAVNAAAPVNRLTEALKGAFEYQQGVREELRAGLQQAGQGPREQLRQALEQMAGRPSQYAAGCNGDLDVEDYSLDPPTFKYDPWDGLAGDGTRTSAFTIQSPHGPVSYKAGLETLPPTDQPMNRPDHLGPAKSLVFGNPAAEDPFGITGTGAAQQVFSHVGGLVLHALKDQRPAFVHFNGIEESRRKLYRAMMHRLPEHTDEYMPYMMTHRGNDIGSYFLVHRDHAKAFEERNNKMWQPAGNPYAVTPVTKKSRPAPPVTSPPDQYAQGHEGIRGSSTAGNPVPPQDPQAGEIPPVETDRPAALRVPERYAIEPVAFQTDPWTERAPGLHLHEFKAADMPMQAIMTERTHEQSPGHLGKAVDFRFRNMGTGSNEYGITGTGNQFHIMSHVAGLALDTLSRRKPAQVGFTAKEPSRKRAYATMLTHLAGKNPDYLPFHTPNPEGEDQFHLVHRDHAPNYQATHGNATAIATRPVKPETPEQHALQLDPTVALERYRAGHWSSEDLERYALERSFEMVN